ncbi:MAG: c-type cytochrome, partial [Thermoguttaceae bacterium]|nr:c-type cytochrome [Thermoguttaceae bacterium]
AERLGVSPPDLSSILEAYETATASPDAGNRQRLLALLEERLDQARFRQELADRRLRFRRAELDEARSAYESAVGQAAPPERLATRQQALDRIQRDVSALAAEAEAAAVHQKALDALLAHMTGPEEAARKALAEHRAEVERLNRALAQQRPGAARSLLRWPLVEAFGRPLAIEQLWLPDLTIDYNFRQVARFDRCTTCHLGIDKTADGSPVEPAYLREETLEVELTAPKNPPRSEADGAVVASGTLAGLYGLALAPVGILADQTPTVATIEPRSPAAHARLRPGDAILRVNGVAVAGREEAEAILLGAERGKPVRLEIRRGLPHPFGSHPRLDLFVGSRSPHPAARFGCTVCHDGQGSATDFAFASHTPNDPAQRARWREDHRWFWNPDWDFPMRPARFAESNCLKCHHDVVDLQPGGAFLDPPAPKLLEGYHLVRQLGCFGCHEIRGFDESGQRVGPDLRLEPAAQGGGAAQEAPSEGAAPAPAPIAPGSMRKTGASLRHVAAKLDSAFVETFVADPAAYRPESRMPRLFGLDEHLEGATLDQTRRFEAVEIRALAEYLRAASLPVEPRPAPAGVTEPPSVERGKRLFEVRGCLACHKHADYPEGKATQGPDLTRLGAKLRTPAGAQWLLGWIRDPTRYSPGTVMPNLLLEPEPLRGDHGPPSAPPRMSDPAADLAAYLLESKGWQPGPRPEPADADLDALARQHLARMFPGPVAEQYLREGIPETLSGSIQGDARELLGPITREKKLRYVGRRTIRKRGCVGCHDVPGLEDALPIGPALSGWGRKRESLLAFEQVRRFVTLRDGGDQPPDDPQQGFFREALMAGRREGFLWQKLGQPRSFDYQKAGSRGFDEQLRMGRFTLTNAQREAIITFILGLVSEPAENRLPRFDARRRAIVEGRKVLDKYACATCHTLELERWTIEFDPEQFPAPPASQDYPFLKPQLAAGVVADSKRTDLRGLCRSELVGMPQWNAQGKLEETEDDEGNPQYAFLLWEPAALGGNIWPVGSAGVLVSDRQIVGKRPPRGGDFSRLLYPVALREAKATGAAAPALEAWGWVPPALVNEGRRVQPGWLYEYLLDPSVIRPAAVLRMPKYNLAPAEAARLVDYFAASAGVEFPYSADPRTLALGRVASDPRRQERREKAMRLVTDRTTFCAKCHLVGDHGPGGDTKTVLAPNLERVARRIRPEYLRRWLANPRLVLPYTAMPVNFPPDKPVGQDLYPGTSLEQLDAVTDLLLNYEEYLRSRVSIRGMIEASGKAK